MTSTSRRLRLATALVAGTALLFSACSSSPQTEPAASQPAASEAAATELTVETDNGTVTIPAEPKRALGFYTTDVDILITLGIALAPEQPIRDDWSAFPSYFPTKELEGVKGFHNYPEFNLEKILDVEPDFILNGLGYETDLHAKLSPIAPTYTYNAFDGSDWRVKFLKVATDLGREDRAKAWLDDYASRIDATKQKIQAKGQAPVVADISYYNGEVNIGCYSISCLIFADLGLEISPLADGDGDGKPDNQGRKLSMEQLGQLSDIDVIFTGVSEDGSGLITEEAALKSNPLWTKLPFVTNGKVYPYNYEMSYGSPSGQDALLEVIDKALA